MTALPKISKTALKWATKNFSGAHATDIRRVKRVINFAALMKDSPGKTIPQLWSNVYDIKATYNLLKHSESIPDNLQRGHRKLIRNEINHPGTYLLIEDDSEFSWSGLDPIEGMGPIGDFRDGLQGFMLHTCLAAKWEDSEIYSDKKRPPLEILGIADQQYFLRQRGVKKTERKQGAPGEVFKETDPWFHSMTRIGDKPQNDQVKWIRVCDRRADIFEQFESSSEKGYDFIIRNAQDRALENSLEDPARSLSSSIEDMPLLGQIEIKLRARNGVKARTAKVNLYAGNITFRPPYRKGIKRNDQAPYRCNVIYVKEMGQLPANVTPIEWILLTSLPIDTFELVREVVRQYTARWVIEEFHKALKSGLKAEELQMEHANRIFATISIMSVVAVSLVELREMARICPEAPADESGLEELEITILSRKLNRKLLTVEDVVLAIGRLGGHMNRRGDGMPGLVTLWRGMTELKTLCEGARLWGNKK